MERAAEVGMGGGSKALAVGYLRSCSTVGG